MVAPFNRIVSVGCCGINSSGTSSFRRRRVLPLAGGRSVTDFACIHLHSSVPERSGGIHPLADFTDSGGPDAVAIALKSNGRDDPYPAVYLRRSGTVKEFLLAPHPLLDFEGASYKGELSAALGDLMSPSLTKAAP